MSEASLRGGSEGTGEESRDDCSGSLRAVGLWIWTILGSQGLGSVREGGDLGARESR